MKKTPEGGVILTKEEAKRIVLVDDDNRVHTFFNLPIALMGSDYSKESVFEDIDKAEVLQLAGKEAQKMGHALAIVSHTPIKQSDILFVETIPEEVEKLLKALK
jgi:hypothetical protein